MHSLHAVLFDLGNTLTASASLAASLVHLSGSPLIHALGLDSARLKPLGEEIEHRIASLNQDSSLCQPHWQDVWQPAAALCGLNLTSDESERLCRAHLQQFVSECKIQPYSLSLLEFLHRADIPLALVSNVTGPVDIFDADLHAKGLAPFFQAVIWSSAVGYRKPDGHIFQAALGQLGILPGKSVFTVGDHEHADIWGGKNMGFTTVKVVKSEDETESAADHIVVGASLLEFFQVVV